MSCVSDLLSVKSRVGGSIIFYIYFLALFLYLSLVNCMHRQSQSAQGKKQHENKQINTNTKTDNLIGRHQTSLKKRWLI